MNAQAHADKQRDEPGAPARVRAQARDALLAGAVSLGLSAAVAGVASLLAGLLR